MGCFPTKDIQIPHPLRSDHLDRKHAQCAENKDFRKVVYHIISRMGATGVQKKKLAPKNPYFFRSGQISKEILN